MKKVLFLIILLISFNIKANIKENLIKSSELLAKNNLIEAEKILKEIVSSKPKDEEERKGIEIANYNLGVINYELKKYDTAKNYFLKVYNNISSNMPFPIYANLYLIDIFLNNNDIQRAIEYAENLNYRTSYKEASFLSYLYYLYYQYGYNNKLNQFYDTILNKIPFREKFDIYIKVANMYLGEKKYDKAEHFYSKLTASKDLEIKQLGYIGIARIESLKQNYKSSLTNINKALNINKKLNINALNQIEEILFLNNDYENLYYFLKIHNSLAKNDVNVLISLIKISKFLNKQEDLNFYLKEFDKINISDFDKGVRLGLENLVEYAETYLSKAKSKGNEKVDEFLLNLYYGLKNEKKLLKHLDKMQNEKKINENIKKDILNEFYQYKKYSKGKNEGH